MLKIQLALLLLYVILLVFIQYTTQQLIFQSPTIPICATSDHYDPSNRPHIAVIAHNSAIGTFHQSSEQGARDAAAILDIQLDWNRHFINSASKMKADIYEAVNSGVDGIIVTIPNDEVAEAVKYALSRHIPVIVFNTGLKYARQLGLTGVVLQNQQSGEFIGKELLKRGYSKPLVLRVAAFDSTTFDARFNGLTTALGYTPDLVTIQGQNNTEESITLVKSQLANSSKYDSIMSLSGSLGTDIVSTVALDILAANPNRKLGVSFFDVGGSNMSTAIMNLNDVIGISQLPYYQAALPVFLMYLKVTTGYHLYDNQTIDTGPTLITKETLAEVMKNELSTLIPIKAKGEKIAAILPNAQGDTYNGAIIAGMNDLAGKLKWDLLNTVEQGPLGLVSHMKKEMDYYVQEAVAGVMLQSSEAGMISYAEQLSNQSSIPLVTIGTFYENLHQSISPFVYNVALDVYKISSKVATSVLDKKFKKPLCLSELTPWKESTFCEMFFNDYTRLASTRNIEIDKPLPIFKINVSTESSMELEVASILRGLSQSNSLPDSYVTMSEHVFDSLNARMAKGYLDNSTSIFTAAVLYDQIQAFLENRITDFWHLNTFSLGFVSVLDILFSKSLTHQPWSLTNFSTSKVEAICYPGTYHYELSKSYFCIDDAGHTVRSIQCAKCPANTYADTIDMSECIPCAFGTYSNIGETSCRPCLEDDPLSNLNKHCLQYFTTTNANRKRFYMSVFIPIGVILFLMFICCLLWMLRKRRRKISRFSDETWLLSYKLLTSPPLPHLPSQSSSSTEALVAPSAPTTYYSIPDSTSPLCPHALEQLHTNQCVSEATAHLALPNDSTKNVSLRSLSSTHEDEKLNYALEFTVGHLHNLPVFLKQIGFKKLKIDESVREEVALIKCARHPNLVEFIGICAEPNATFIVEEFCAKGTLADVLVNPDIDLSWIFRFSLINDLLEGIDFLQRSRFGYHGTLTSFSCLITGKWELKITDYGLRKIHRTQIDTSVLEALRKNSQADSKELASDRLQFLTSKENLLWVAPETVTCTSSGLYTTFPSKPADLYSVGIIMNEILTREKPYKDLLNQGFSYENIFWRIREENLTVSMRPTGEDEHTDAINLIISDCLKADPNTRPSCMSIKNQMKLIDPYQSTSDNVVDNLANLLEKYANDMENLVHKRTANLQQRTLELEEERARTQTLLKDLKAAKDIAEAAATTKQNFLANMSHEIRTPMNAVIGMSRILMESDLPPELQDCADTIESSGKHLMTIIDDILDYSKIESGKLSLEKRILDTTYVIESAVKLVAPNFLDKDLTLWYEIDPNVPVRVYGDLVRIRQVVLNLLSNALKFTKNGHVCIEVHVSPHGELPRTPSSHLIEEGISDSQHHDPETAPLIQKEAESSEKYVTLVVSVSDTGIGIPKDKLNNLFQSFSQVDASTTRNFGGTGLGLAISRRLCRMMGGDMWLESEYGVGSKFSFQAVFQKQTNSPSYGEQNNLQRLSKLCRSPLIVTEKRPSQKAWSSLISSFLINNTRTFTYDQLVSYLRSTPESIETKHSILIVDTDLTVIQGFGLQPTSSEAVINKIRSLFPSMANVPTLCINDFRARSASKAEKPPNILGQQANISHLEDNHIITLQEKSNDSFDCTSNPIYYLCKPFKNSKLLSALHQLLNPQKKSSVTSTEPLSASSQSQTLSFSSTRSPDSDNRTRSLSSTPDRPLGDILSGINSLLVDDNPINQKVLSRMLSRMGLKPQLAQNGREACDMVIAAKENGTPIDLIFMDIWMPEMNGLEASTKIRQDIASSAVNPYIIAMTACVMPGDREKCINAGMNGYVSKPVRKEELEAALHTYTQTIMINEQQDTDGDGPHSQSSTEEHSCPSTLDMEFTNDHDLPTVSVTLYDDK